MVKKRISSGTRRQRSSSSRGAKGGKFEALTGGEIQGRAGEDLPIHERTVLGDDDDWEREMLPDEPHSVRRKSAGRPARKSAPGSKFQVKGRGTGIHRPATKSKNVRKK